MIDEIKDKQKIEDYLLNKSSEEVCEEIEQRLLDDDEFYEFFLAIECDLQENYLEGSFSESEKEAFDKYFLAHPQRQEDLWLTKALKEKALKTETFKFPATEKKPLTGSFSFRKWFPILAPGFGILILALLGLMWWNSNNSDLNKGLLALKDAYKTERPLQSRVTDFEYSPFVQRRGNEEKETAELRMAETFLIQAVKTRPSSDSYHALGKFYLTSKKFDQAIENFNLALKLDANNSKLNNNLGVAWLEKGKFDSIEDKRKAPADFAESLKYLDQAISLDKNSLEALFNRSETYQYLHLPEKAIEDLQNYLQKDSNSRWADEARQRLKILEEQKNKVSLTEDEIIENFKLASRSRNVNQAWQMIKLARSRTGNFILQRLISDFLQQPPDTEESKNNLALMKFAAEVEKNTVGDFFSSDLVNFYSKITPSGQELMLKARSVMKEAQTQYNNSKYQLAADKYAEAKKTFTEAGNMPEAMFAENWRGFSNLRIPNIQESLAIFNELSQKYKTQKYLSFYAQSLNGIADANSNDNKPSEALAMAEKALPIATQIQDVETQIRSYQNIIVIKSDLGQSGESLEKGFQAIALAQDFPTKPNVLWTLYKVSAANFHELNLLNSAITYQEKAAQLATQPILKSRSLTQLAIFQSENGNFGEALKSAEKALLPDEPQKDEAFQQNITAQVSMTLGDIYRHHRDFQAALENYQKSQNIYEGTLDLETDLYRIYGGKVLCLIGLNQFEAAQKELDKAFEKLEVLRKNIKNEDDRNQFFDLQQNYYDTAIGFASSQLKDKYLALDYAEKSRARTLLNLTNPEVAPQSAKELQSYLSNNVQILEYAVLDDRIMSWVITKDKVESLEVPVKYSDLKRDIREYLNLLISSNESEKDNLDEAGRKLHQLLIAPNQSFLDAQKTLFVVPDKDLNFLPVASLINSQTNKYLIEDFKLGVSSSLNLFVLSSEKAGKKEQFRAEKILSIGNPRFDREKFSHLENLPSAEREARRIAEFYESPNLLSPEQATKEKVSAELNEFEIIHLALHAVTDARNPNQSGFVLTKSGNFDDILHAEEIYAKKDLPKTKLVVLSACETGIEKAIQGEGAIGLARPFIADNVPLVVASLWKVNSEVTAELMINFHRNRKQKGLISLEALRQAQLEMLTSSNSSFRHPGAWASFIVIGGEANY